MEERARNDGSRILTVCGGEGRAVEERGGELATETVIWRPESEPGMSYVIFLPDILTGVPIPLAKRSLCGLNPVPKLGKIFP